MKNILVTGGAGFIGSHVVDRLLAEGVPRVTAVDNFDDFYDPATKRANVAAHLPDRRYTLVEADIRDRRAIDALFERERFDAVVHLAARAGVRPSVEDPLAYEETNVRGTYVLLEAARRSGVGRFVFGSSSSVYGVNTKTPFSEDDATASAVSPYAATKLAGESACHVYSHLYGMRVVCLRFFTVYGARQRPDLAIHKFARSIDSGRPITVYGGGSARRDYTFVDDIVSGVVASLRYDQSSFEIVNLGGARTTELSRLIALLEATLGRHALIDRRDPQPGDVPITFADVGKARRLLGYEPRTSLETGIEKFVEWFRGRRILERSTVRAGFGAASKV
jgi:UDP-glucuronate 4-epimerase